MANLFAVHIVWKNRRFLFSVLGFLILGGFFFSITGITMLGYLIAGTDERAPALPGSFTVGGATTVAMQDIPQEYVDIFKSAEKKYGIPWTMLAAIAKHDSGFGRAAEKFVDLKEMQWEEYSVDGDLDGQKKPSNPWDAVYSMANCLSQTGFEDNPAGALYHIYKSGSHVEDICQTAESYIDVLLPVISGKWPLPREYTRINSSFGIRFHPTKHKWKQHTGMDVGAPAGTPIYPASDGVVTSAGWGGDYGNLVVISHPSHTQTWYAHLSEINVERGQEVKREDILGLVGSTGASTGPHLHFEVRLNGVPIDPEPWLK